MAPMTELLPRRTMKDELALRMWVTEALALKLITRSQWEVIIDTFAPLVPVTLSVSQRTPKGVLYVFSLNPDTARLTTYYLNHRAKWIKITPPTQREPEPLPDHRTWKLV